MRAEVVLPHVLALDAFKITVRTGEADEASVHSSHVIFKITRFRTSVATIFAIKWLHHGVF